LGQDLTSLLGLEQVFLVPLSTTLELATREPTCELDSTSHVDLEQVILPPLELSTTRGVSTREVGLMHVSRDQNPTTC